MDFSDDNTLESSFTNHKPFYLHSPRHSQSEIDGSNIKSADSQPLSKTSYDRSNLDNYSVGLSKDSNEIEDMSQTQNKKTVPVINSDSTESFYLHKLTEVNNNPVQKLFQISSTGARKLSEGSHNDLLKVESERLNEMSRTNPTSISKDMISKFKMTIIIDRLDIIMTLLYYD